MANRFQKLRELGSKGKTYNPLVLEEFQWENEWVDINCDPVHQGYASAAAAPGSDDLTWADVDRAMSASQNLRGGRNVPRAARGDVIKSTSTNQQTQITYTKRKKRSRIATGDEDNNEHDDGGGNDPSLVEAELLAEDEEMDDQEEDEAATAFASSGEGGGPGGFQLDDALDV
uniref:Uncharacterized protein n=1 Tax=Arundo donax TaxID=35708 RepID=A0A0A8YET6_ARUDO